MMHGTNMDSLRSPESTSHSVLEVFLERFPSVRFLRLQWQDLSGILRCRVVPVDQGRRIAAGKKPMRLSPCSLNLAVDNSVLPRGSLLGSDTGFPDWSSLRTREHLDPLYASVMCRVLRNPDPEHHRFVLAADHCPRRALTTVLRKAAHQFSLEFLVGFEVEFEIFARNTAGAFVPHSVGMGMNACAGLREPYYKFVEVAMQILLQAGVGIEAIHTEGMRGQYEFCLAPKPPMQAIDELIFVHDTLKRVFIKQGLMATMFPRPVKSRPQSIGQHTHVSISNPELEEPFLAGLLKYLPRLSSLYLPYELSYDRLKPGQAGGRVVAWGLEDRRVPIRKIEPGHWEIRCTDATANMYLALAATLSAGLLGCVNGEPLELKDSAKDEHPDGQPLPNSLDDALNLIDTEQCADTDEERGLGDVERFMESDVIRHYLALKRFELSRLSSMGTEEARNWLVELF